MYKSIPLLTLLLCLAANATAQDSELLHRYRSKALDYNHDLKAAARNISAGLELEKAAKADLKPKLSAGASFRYVGEPTQLSLNLPGAEAPVGFRGKEINYGASLTLLQPIYAGGLLLENIRMAQHKQQLAAHEAELIRSGICFQTDIQYWNTVARNEVATVAGEFRNGIANLVKVIAERKEVGLVDPQDLLMAEVKLNDAEYLLLQAQTGLEAGRMAFNSLIGEALQTTTELEATVPEVATPTPSESANAATRPELLMAGTQLRMAESAFKVNDSRYKPQLYVGVDGTFSSPGYNFTANPDPNYAVYATLSVPIFEWGKRRSEKRASTHRIAMASDQMNRVQDEVSLEVATARLSLDRTLSQVRLTGNSLQKASENERKALERYAEGKVSVIEVIEAQTYRHTSRLNYIQAKVEAQGAYSALLKATNSYNVAP